MAKDGADIDKAPDLVPDAVPSSKSRRKSGNKHRDKSSRDYARRRYMQSQYDSYFANSECSADTYKVRIHFKATQNFSLNVPNNEPCGDSSSSSSSSEYLSFAREIMAALRRQKNVARQIAPHRNDRRPRSESDDYTAALHKDLTSYQPCNSKSNATVSEKRFSRRWRENGTNWQGPSYDSKYSFNGWKQDWGRLLDHESPYLEAVPTLTQQRA